MSGAHRWDTIRRVVTVIEPSEHRVGGVHESCVRSYQILNEVKAMLARGDSPKTIQTFVEWAEADLVVAERRHGDCGSWPMTSAMQGCKACEEQKYHSFHDDGTLA